MTHAAESPGPRVGSRSSRVLVVVFAAWIVGFGVLAYFYSLVPPAGAQIVESPFKGWDGTWEGELAVYSWQGEPKSRMRVRRELKHAFEKDAFRQESRTDFENLATGEKIEERAVNTAPIHETMVGRLKRQILAEDSRSVVAYDGRREGPYLFWSRSLPDAVETLREWVEGDTLCLEGTRLLGDRAAAEPEILVGRFRRAAAALPPETPPESAPAPAPAQTN